MDTNMENQLQMALSSKQRRRILIIGSCDDYRFNPTGIIWECCNKNPAPGCLLGKNPVSSEHTDIRKYYEAQEEE